MEEKDFEKYDLKYLLKQISLKKTKKSQTYYEMLLTSSSFPRWAKFTVPAFKILYIFEIERKIRHFVLIRFSFLSISENKRVLVILPKKLTFRSE